jgi:hypothetical protein
MINHAVRSNAEAERWARSAYAVHMRHFSPQRRTGEGGGLVLARDINVGAVVYAVSDTAVDALLVADGRRERYRLGTLAALLPRLDGLREELRRTMAVARGRVPRLRAFGEDWGRALLPPELLADPPDVVVLVPHAMLHDVPLHLVNTNEGEPLGVRAGVSYASSQALFTRCASRNPARWRDLAAWRLDGPNTGARQARVVAGGTDVLNRDQEPFQEVVRRIAERWPDTKVERDEFPSLYSRTAVKRSFRHGAAVDAVCVVAHGFIDNLDHRQSGLLLRTDPGVGRRPIRLYGHEYPFRDLPLRQLPAQLEPAWPAEILTAAELSIAAEASCELVALLGCSAGWGRVLQGDEPASLAESFLHLGAASVVAPMWDSDVGVTAAWIDRFFEAWLGGDCPKALAASVALRSLQAEGHGPERAGVLTLRGDWL